MKVLAAMAAIAITLGLNGTAEVWELPADPTQNWVQVAAPATVVDERACLTVPIHTDDDEGFLLLGPESEFTHTGGLTVGDVRVALIGPYLNIGFGQSGVSSWDMVLTSIDVTGLAEVTICE